MPYAVLIAALIAADQLVKGLVRAHIPLYGRAPFIPYLVELTHVRNTGAAFSLLSSHTWLLTAISSVVAVGIAVLLLRGLVPHRFGRISLSVVLAGAAGNLIDRFFLGYVVDMFHFTFIDFAVFNIADICVVCGGIATCVYLLFFFEKWNARDGASHEDPASDR